MIKKIIVFIILILLFAANQNSYGERSWQGQRYVFSNGGSLVSTGKPKLLGSIGQGIVGRLTNSSNKSGGIAGFWADAAYFTNTVDVIDNSIHSESINLRNSPNPFDISTNITFNLNKPSKVLIKIYDAMGNDIKTLADELFEAGEHELTFNAHGFSTGSYYCTISADNIFISRRIILIH
jgi:hypothetical protein